mmetsp:Transcript_142167/g.247761  ORF Transcript_142167/g.247761 Transcript_142167/m.247761 type:complete len:503 (-) Transcript_142167:47-1555(-)
MAFERICGIDANKVLSYEAVKVVRFNDRRLGALYYSLMFLIVCYIFVYQILYGNEHFEKRDVYGTARLTIQQPTVDTCNPNDADCKSDYTPLTQLPYCDVYNGSSTLVAPENRYKCTYLDRHSLNPYGMMDSSMLVPTRADMITEQKGCHPGPENGYSCDNEWNIFRSNSSSDRYMYVADIERFTLLFSHTYRRDSLSGSSDEIQGWLDVCPPGENGSDKRIFLPLESHRNCPTSEHWLAVKCLTTSCGYVKNGKAAEEASLLQSLLGYSGKGSGVAAAVSGASGLLRHRGRSQRILSRQEQMRTDAHDGDEGYFNRAVVKNATKAKEQGIYAIASGDIFRVDKLLQLGGLDLDLSTNKDGESLRKTGGVIEVEVTYNNMHSFSSSFGNKDVFYEYRVNARPIDEFKTEILAVTQPLNHSFRTIEDRHGFYVVVKIGGQFGYFSMKYLLLMLITALGLLSGATVATNILAAYLPDGQHYTQCMREEIDRADLDKLESSSSLS